MFATDRRAAPRHTLQPLRVHLVWEDAAELQHVMASLRDISSSGAAVALSAPVHPKGPAVLAIEGNRTQQWVRAEVVDVTNSAEGERRVGLRFVQRCPNRLFHRALAGDAAEPKHPTVRPTDPASVWYKRSERSRASILGHDRPRDSRWLPVPPLLPPVASPLGIEVLV